MKNIFKGLLVAAALLISGVAVAGAVLGKDYKALNPVQETVTKKIEVLEFFSYQCIHCFHLHNLLVKWEKNLPKDVDLTYVPVPHFQPSWEPVAYAYYSLESMGKIKQLDDVIYRAIHVDNVKLYDLNSITDFVAKNGVDRAKFSDTYNSFTIQSKVTRAKQISTSYFRAVERAGLVRMGTPMLIVDGKYVIGPSQPADTIRVLNEVIETVRKERSAKHKAK